MLLFNLISGWPQIEPGEPRSARPTLWQGNGGEVKKCECYGGAGAPLKPGLLEWVEAGFVTPPPNSIKLSSRAKPCDSLCQSHGAVEGPRARVTQAFEPRLSLRGNPDQIVVLAGVIPLDCADCETELLVSRELLARL